MNDKAPVSHPRNQVADVTGAHRELPFDELLFLAGVEEIKMKKSPPKPNDVEAQTIGEITFLLRLKIILRRQRRHPSVYFCRLLLIFLPLL